MALPLGNLSAIQREIYRDSFKQAVANGEAKPFLLPFALVSTFISPILYLSIPHTSRPWLYQARFAVMAVVVALNVEMMWTMSSCNNAFAYAVGLAGSWGIIWNLTLLIWTRPQFEAERVEKRMKVPQPAAAAQLANGVNGAVTPQHLKSCNGTSSIGTTTAKGSFSTAPDEDIAKSLQDGYEYYWQAYPADAPFLTRLDWAVDMSFSFRGGGWNRKDTDIPRFELPEKLKSGELVKLSTIPMLTRSGFRRYKTHEDFIRAKLTSMAVGYLVLDFCSVFMMKDPYFIYGPSAYPLPRSLASLPPGTLSMYRSMLAFAGILAALHMIFSFDQLVRCLFLRRVFGARSELWHYPSIFGSFGQVLDRGLAGFWGAWWHQTFRIAFSAPGAWLVDRGYLDPRSPAHHALGALLAFLQSGILHAAGSVTSIPATKPWIVPLFFLLSWLGIVLQTVACEFLRRRGVLTCVPRPLRRAGNLAFVLAWMLLTNWAFIDDLGRCALFLYEPVPISPLRFLGLGAPGDSWWRWDRDLFPSLYVGEHWWDSGIGL